MRALFQDPEQLAPPVLSGTPRHRCPMDKPIPVNVNNGAMKRLYFPEEGGEGGTIGGNCAPRTGG